MVTYWRVEACLVRGRTRALGWIKGVWEMENDVRESKMRENKWACGKEAMQTSVGIQSGKPVESVGLDPSVDGIERTSWASSPKAVSPEIGFAALSPHVLLWQPGLVWAEQVRQS
ncbi:unnamed protein product, partial [Vitis vinifera]